jgi:hypothetical protein
MAAIYHTPRRGEQAFFAAVAERASSPFRPVTPPPERPGWSFYQREIMENIGFFRLFSAFHPPHGRATHVPANHPIPSRVSMSAKRFPWFSMLASLPLFQSFKSREAASETFV